MQKGGILNIYCFGGSFKQFIYFQTCTCVFIIFGVITVTRHSLFSADGNGGWGEAFGCTRQWQERRAIALFDEDPLLRILFIRISSEGGH